MSDDAKKADLKNKMITALLEALEEELTYLVTDITMMRDAVKAVSALWHSQDPKTILADGTVKP